jgi:hypothetical protein
MTTSRRVGLAVVLYALASLLVIWLVPPGSVRWGASTALFLVFAGYLAALARAPRARW